MLQLHLSSHLYTANFELYGFLTPYSCVARQGEGNDCGG